MDWPRSLVHMDIITFSHFSEMLGPGLRLYMWLYDKGKKSKVSAPPHFYYMITYVLKVVNHEPRFHTNMKMTFLLTLNKYWRKSRNLCSRWLFISITHTSDRLCCYDTMKTLSLFSVVLGDSQAMAAWRKLTTVEIFSMGFRMNRSELERGTI